MKVNLQTEHYHILFALPNDLIYQQIPIQDFDESIKTWTDLVNMVYSEHMGREVDYREVAARTLENPDKGLIVTDLPIQIGWQACQGGCPRGYYN